MAGVRVVEQNPVLRLGIHSMLAGIAPVEKDVVLLGLSVPGDVQEVERLSPQAPVVVLTALDSPAVLVRALAAGALGCLLYGHFGTAELEEAISAAILGQSRLSPPVATALVGWLQGGSARTRMQHELTPRESEIMNLVAQGFSNRRIADLLFISEKTVKNHVHQIYKRLRADGRDHAVARWRDISDFPAKAAQ